MRSIIGPAAGGLLALQGALAVTLAPNAAQADGYGRPYAAYRVEQPCAARKFAGLYAGGHAGLAFVGASFEDVDGYAAGGRSVDRDNTGSLVGIQVGYNWTRCSLLYGIEWDFSWATASQGGYDAAGGYHLSQSLDYLSSLRGRIGWANGNWLYYGTLGIALAGTSTSYTNASVSGAATGLNSFEAGTSQVGVVIGGGAEYALSDSILLNGSLLYYGFGDRTITYQHVGSVVHRNGQQFDFDENYSAFVARIGVSFRIGNGRNE